MKRSDRNPISTHNGYVKLKNGLFNQELFEIPDSEFTFLDTKDISDYEFQEDAGVYRQIQQRVEFSIGTTTILYGTPGEVIRETVSTENMNTAQLIEYFDRISQDE